MKALLIPQSQDAKTPVDRRYMLMGIGTLGLGAFYSILLTACSGKPDREVGSSSESEVEVDCNVNDPIPVLNPNARGWPQLIGQEDMGSFFDTQMNKYDPSSPFEATLTNKTGSDQLVTNVTYKIDEHCNFEEPVSISRRFIVEPDEEVTHEVKEDGTVIVPITLTRGMCDQQFINSLDEIYSSGGGNDPEVPFVDSMLNEIGVSQDHPQRDGWIKEFAREDYSIKR